MKAIILAAGYGSRLLPLTSALPKCLVPVDGRSILERQLEALREAGVREAVIVAGYRHEQIAEFLRHPRPIPTTFVINPFWSVANSIGSIWCARSHLDEPFLLMNGDTIFEERVLAEAVCAGSDGVGLLVEATDQLALDDMRAIVVEEEVRSVGKTLPVDQVTHRSLGVIVSHGSAGAYGRALDAVIMSKEGHSCYHHAVVDRLSREARVKAIEHRSGRWQEIDRPEDITSWINCNQAPLL